MTETAPQNPSDMQFSSVETQTPPVQITREQAQRFGGIVLEGNPTFPDSPAANDIVDTSNLVTANMMLDAYEAGAQSAEPDQDKIQSQTDEAWDNHLGIKNQDRLDEAEEAISQSDAEIETTIEQSMTDKLTGLKNREAMELLISKVGIEGISGVALVDMNDFKGANDNFGHRAGDKVLQRFAALAQKRLSGDESVPGSELGEIFRIGGDEFAVVFYGGRNVEDIKQAISDIEAQTSEIVLTPDEDTPANSKLQSWTAGSSIGFAPSNEFYDLNGGLALADQDMFAKKEASRPEGYVGRNQAPAA